VRVYIQVPFEQLCPGLHTLPQPPQLAGSSNTFTQALLHEFVSPPQPQPPLRHDAPAPHSLPQPPQLEGSAVVSTQVEPHRGSPAGHTQLPLWQC
jgi:hypothetical protein